MAAATWPTFAREERNAVTRLGAELARMAAAVVRDETPDPKHVGALRPQAVVAHPHGFAHGGKEGGRGRTYHTTAEAEGREFLNGCGELALTGPNVRYTIRCTYRTGYVLTRST